MPAAHRSLVFRRISRSPSKSASRVPAKATSRASVNSPAGMDTAQLGHACVLPWALQRSCQRRPASRDIRLLVKIPATVVSAALRATMDIVPPVLVERRGSPDRSHSFSFPSSSMHSWLWGRKSCWPLWLRLRPRILPDAYMYLYGNWRSEPCPCYERFHQGLFHR